MRHEQTWGRKQRPRKADGGHTAVRFGNEKRGPYTTPRGLVECQCGTILSGNGFEGGLRSYEKHRKRELSKQEEAR